MSQSEKLLSHSNRAIYICMIVLTFFFLLFEISFFIQCNSDYFADFSTVASKLKIPYTILPGVIRFIFTQLSLHLLFSLALGWITIQVARLVRLDENKKFLLGIIIWLCAASWFLFANHYFFPNSKFAELIPSIGSQVFFWGLSVINSLFIVLSLIASFKHHPKMFTRLVGLVMLCCIPFLFSKKPIPPIQSKLPNIILIGMDSVRPDYLSFYGGKAHTPVIDHFLQHSVNFNQAYTPLARTFPSWMSILTGEYPKNNGIRFDLASQKGIQFNETIPAILKKEGYQTFYITDETRFSNISKNIGFDHIIAPPTGLNDFLLGTMNDFPLSNLLVNTIVGKWLFPYSYANRPVYFTYDPNTFIRLIRSQFHLHSNQTVFIAIHFCLPHTPYLWAELNANHLTAIERYQKSIERVDQQIGDFYQLLAQQHLLNHAIVMMFSDHGEGLELKGDRVTNPALFVSTANDKKPPAFYPPMLDHEQMDESAGHGTDVLGLTQYRTVLGIQMLGYKNFLPRTEIYRVSLLDIKPTILTLLNLPLVKTDGMTLTPLLIHAASAMKEEDFFIESDFSPMAIRTVYPQTNEVVLEGAHLFQIDSKTTHLTVKPSMGQMIIHSKQHADLYQQWILALYPQDNHRSIPILVNLSNGLWTNNLRSHFAKNSPAAHMLFKLRQFYGQELTQTE